MRAKKKNHLITGIVVGAIILIFAVGIIALFNFLQGMPRQEEKAEIVVVLKDSGAAVDLPNTEEGTLKIDFRAVESDVDVAESSPTKILLFRSRMLDGLNVYYLFEEKKISAGIPQLKSSEINLLDGSMHTIIYTFKKGYKQMLLVDGQIMAEGEFSPAIKHAPTGFLVNAPDNELEIETEKTSATIVSYGVMVEPDQASMGKLE